VDLLSSTLLTLQSSMQQFIFVASHLLAVTRSTETLQTDETQSTPLPVQPSLPPFLPHPTLSISVAPPLNPLPPFPLTGINIAPTYSYITQQTPPPKPVLSHQQPPPQNIIRVRVCNLQSHRSRDRPAYFWCGDTDHLTSECRNTLVCFSFNCLGHRSHQCRITIMFQPPPPQPTPKAAAQANTLPMIKFYSTPANQKFRQTFQNSIVLHDELSLGPIYTQTHLNKLFNIPGWSWVARALPNKKYLIEPPNKE
jgi:hypothetical protein